MIDRGRVEGNGQTSYMRKDMKRDDVWKREEGAADREEANMEGKEEDSGKVQVEGR